MGKSNKKAVAPTVPEEAAPSLGAPAVSADPAQLTIADLQLLARIIDLASRRGAFQAGELSQVGDVFNKLSSFLAHVESSQKKEDAQSDAAE